MSSARAALLPFTPVGSSAVIADRPAVFECIFDDRISVCVWNRQPDSILTEYIREAACSASWERRARVDVTEPRFDELLAGFKADAGRTRWEAELATLVDLCATLTDAQTLGLRMSATAGATCPRFHSDQVGIRMLCTWLGEGTEWLAEEDVIRPDMGSAAGPVRAGAVVRQMLPFAVGAFKGDLWPGNDGRGAVHRSPQPTGWRVFVSLDEL